MMYEDNFRKALFDALTPEFEQILSSADDSHEFSSKFKKKMRKLINRRKKPYYKLINTVGKRIACVIVAIIVASSVTVLSVEALREKVADFFIEVYKKFSIVETEPNKTVPMTIEDIYGITYGLEDFEVVYENISEIEVNMTYVNGEQIVYYSQRIIDGLSLGVNTENAEISTITVQGHEAMYFVDNHKYHRIIWNNGDYIICIGTNISKDALIKMSESVQKVEFYK